MVVAGGVYVESCRVPLTLALLGSGGRAAYALSGRSPVVLETFHPVDRFDDLVANFAPLGVEVRAHPSTAVVGFRYAHPLSTPRVSPIPLPAAAPAAVAAPTVLRFGCLEGSFVVDADVAVFDPQCEAAPERFAANGSRARRLALVLNAREARASSGRESLDEAARALAARDGAEVVVVKDGPAGAHVFERGARVGSVPAYETRGSFKIGSGDVFSAVFAWSWARVGMDAPDAADHASRHAARYVDERTLPCPATLPAMEPLRSRARPAVVVVGDPSTAAGRWLLDEVCDGLERLGATPLVHRRGSGIDHPVPPDASILVLMGTGSVPAIPPGGDGRRVVVFADRADDAEAARGAGHAVEGDLQRALLGAVAP